MRPPSKIKHCNSIVQGQSSHATRHELPVLLQFPSLRPLSIPVPLATTHVLHPPWPGKTLGFNPSGRPGCIPSHQEVEELLVALLRRFETFSDEQVVLGKSAGETSMHFSPPQRRRPARTNTCPSKERAVPGASSSFPVRRRLPRPRRRTANRTEHRRSRTLNPPSPAKDKTRVLAMMPVPCGVDMVQGPL